MLTSESCFLDIFMANTSNTAKEVKLKTRLQLQDVLKRAQNLVQELTRTKTRDDLGKVLRVLFMTKVYGLKALFEMFVVIVCVFKR